MFFFYNPLRRLQVLHIAWALSLITAPVAGFTIEADLEISSIDQYHPNHRIDRRVSNNSTLSLQFRGQLVAQLENSAAELIAEVNGAEAINKNGPDWIDVSELYLRQDVGIFELIMGSKKVFWGVLESYRPVDIINQRNWLEGPGEPNKLGQPMIQLATVGRMGQTTLYVLPYFRERKFRSVDSPLGLPFKLASESIYESHKAQYHLDLALRWSYYVNSWDFALFHFRGTDRAPLLSPIFNAEGAIHLQQAYTQVRQSGFELQSTQGAWLLKSEAVFHDSHATGQHSQIGLGIEHLTTGLAGGHSDLTFIAEYLFSDESVERTQLFQDDIVFALKWSLNNLAGTQVKFSIQYDLSFGSDIVSLEAQRRYFNDWQGTLQLRFFSDAKSDPALSGVEQDDYFKFKLSYFF